MKCKIHRYAREGIECPTFDNTNDCWYEHGEGCKHVENICYGDIAIKQINEDKLLIKGSEVEPFKV